VQVGVLQLVSCGGVKHLYTTVAGAESIAHTDIQRLANSCR
jgi:hypothetical protein